MVAADPISRAEELDVEAIYRLELAGIIRLLRGGFRYRNRAQEHRFVKIDSLFEVEEICQETFSRFMDQCAKGNYDSSRPAGPYLRRIAMNVALRKLGRSTKEQPVDTFEEEAVDAATALEKVVDAETRDLVEEFKATLSGQDRRIAEGCLVEGLSQAKMGAELGVSRDKVYRSLREIRANALRFFNKKGWKR